MNTFDGLDEIVEPKALNYQIVSVGIKSENFFMGGAVIKDERESFGDRNIESCLMINNTSQHKIEESAC